MIRLYSVVVVKVDNFIICRMIHRCYLASIEWLIFFYFFIFLILD